MCMMSTPANGLKSGWRWKLKNISPMSMSHCEYTGSKVVLVGFLELLNSLGSHYPTKDSKVDLKSLHMEWGVVEL